MKLSKVLFIISIVLVIISIILILNSIFVGLKLGAIGVCFLGLALIALHYEHFKTEYYE